MGSVVIKGSTSGDVTLAAPAIAGSSTLTLPAINDTLVGLQSTQTITNKTLTSPVITTPTITTPTITTPTVSSGSILNASGRPMVAQTGSVLQVVQNSYTSKSTLTGNGTTYYATGLSASITPLSTSSRIFILVSFGCIGMNTANVTTAFRIYRDATPVGSGVPAGSRQGSIFRFGYWTGDGNHSSGVTFSYLDSPASTSAITYAAYAQPQNGQTTYINYTILNSDNADSYATYTASYITLMEIAG